ncbi:acyltransferase [Roseivirga pacifica]|uniref:acyltransferase n=1 Tax=Roseivirga pacifica TaxID=1267423 RepID=UPI003BB1588C
MKKLITLFVCFFLPVYFSSWLLNLLGHCVSRKAKIGFSIVWKTKLYLDDYARIGHLNLIAINTLKLGKKAYIGRLNYLSGLYDINFDEHGAIGNSCVVTRAPAGVSYGTSELRLGLWSKITANHKIDMMRSVRMGNYTTIAGSGSQIWTHGYLHGDEGLTRFRIDGEINIGNNVYIGSKCIINAGIAIANGITIGSGSCVSKNLDQKGMYVSQPLRFFEKDYEASKARLKKVEDDSLVEQVYTK